MSANDIIFPMLKKTAMPLDIIKPWFDFSEKRPSLGNHGALQTPKG